VCWAKLWNVWFEIGLRTRCVRIWRDWTSQTSDAVYPMRDRTSKTSNLTMDIQVGHWCPMSKKEPKPRIFKCFSESVGPWNGSQLWLMLLLLLRRKWSGSFAGGSICSKNTYGDGKLVDNFSHESDVTSLQDPFMSCPYKTPFYFYYCVSRKIRRGILLKKNECPASSFSDLLAFCRAVLVMRIQLRLSLGVHRRRG